MTPDPRRDTFVLTVCGDEHARRAEFALCSYKKFTRSDVVILAARCRELPRHDQVIPCPLPDHWSDAQCSRLLKTGLHRFLTLDRRYCYVDNDVFAVSPRAAEVFALKRGPVMFGRDPGKTVRRFSRYATRGVGLAEAIRHKFGLTVDEKWPIWNGGVFVFDDESRALLDTWNGWTESIFDDSQWHTRDQGTLVAAVWHHGLQDQPVLPPEYTWLHKLHSGLRPHADGFRTRQGREVALLHFPVTYGQPKYACWRTVVRLLGGTPPADGFRPVPTDGLPVPPGWSPGRSYLLDAKIDWHRQIADRLAAYLRDGGHEVRLSRAARVRRDGQTARSCRGIYIRRSDEAGYALIDFHDTCKAAPAAVRAAAQDPDCRLVLKAQYRADHYPLPLGLKIRPYTYFEKNPLLFQRLLPDLRRLEKQSEQLYFRGTRIERRGPVLDLLADLLVEPCDRLDLAAYYRDAATARIGLSLPGYGNVCHREIEYFGLGIPTIMPRLKNRFHCPLLPDFHYIAVDVDTVRQSPAQIAAAIRATYERVRQDRSYLEFVAANARHWYDENVWFPNSIQLTARLLGIPILETR